jgi:hypothetical protein
MNKPEVEKNPISALFSQEMDRFALKAIELYDSCDTDQERNAFKQHLRDRIEATL